MVTCDHYEDRRATVLAPTPPHNKHTHTHTCTNRENRPTGCEGVGVGGEGKMSKEPEPVFVDLVRSLRIDSQPGGPVLQPYLSYRHARLHRLAKSIPRNRFLVSINIYKYGLWEEEPGFQGHLFRRISARACKVLAADNLLLHYED
jgi:hypothetical protein